MANAALATKPSAQAANDVEETIEVDKEVFTRSQIEDGSLFDDHIERIGDALAKDLYYERYQPENRVRDLSESGEIAEALFDRHDDDARNTAMSKLAEGGSCPHWLLDEEIMPAVEKFREELTEEAEALGWNIDLGVDEDDFDREVSQYIEEKLMEDDDSKPVDLLSSCDRVEVIFILMPNEKGIYADDYCIYSHKAWADWEHLNPSQGLLEVLPRLGYTLSEYRKHSKNKHERSDALSTYKRRRPILTLDEFQEIVENACSSAFNIGIYAQVPLRQLLEIDLERPVMLTEYSICSFSDSGTFHDIQKKEPIVLRPEDGIWKSFGNSGPSDWCGLSGNYYHADIKN